MWHRWQGHRLCLCGPFLEHLQPQLTPRARARCPRSPAVTAVPAMFPRLMCASQSHSLEPVGKGLRCDTLRQPPSSLVSLRPAPKECAGPVPTAAAGAARPQRSPPRPLVPAATSRCRASHSRSPPSSSPPWTQPEVPAETWPGRAAPGNLPPPRRSEAEREMQNKLPRAGNASGGPGSWR